MRTLFLLLALLIVAGTAQTQSLQTLADKKLSGPVSKVYLWNAPGGELAAEAEREVSVEHYNRAGVLLN